MGFLDTLKQMATGKPLTIKDPTFVKEFTEENQQLNDLHELLKIAPKAITDKINEDIKMQLDVCTCQDIQQEKLPNVLVKDGRVAILTFHSGEDRLVKKSFKSLLREGVYSEIAKEVIRPTVEECNMNNRARSAKMRWAIKA